MSYGLYGPPSPEHSPWSTFDDGYEEPAPRFDPRAMLSGLIDSVRMPVPELDDFDEPLATASDHPARAYTPEPSTHAGAYTPERLSTPPARFYVPERGFMSEAGAQPDPSYFDDHAMPRGWKGKGRADDGWDDFARDPTMAMPSWLPQRGPHYPQHGFPPPLPGHAGRPIESLYDVHEPQDDRSRLAQLDMMRQQEIELDRQRLRQWERQLRQDDNDRRNALAHWQQQQAQANAQRAMMAQQTPFQMPMSSMPMMQPPMIPPGLAPPFHPGFNAPPVQSDNVPPFPLGLGAPPNVPPVPLGTGASSNRCVAGHTDLTRAGHGISPLVNSLDVHPAGNNGRARFTDQFMEDLRGLNSKLRDAMSEKIAALTDLHAHRVAMPNVGPRR